MRSILLALLLVLAACGTDEVGNRPEGAVRVTAANLPPGYINEPYNTTFVAEGGTRPYLFKLEGPLPRGITFTRTGLTGTPQEKGSYKLRVIVEDASLSTSFKELTLTVSDPPPPTLAIRPPQSEVSTPFILPLRLEGSRDSRGFQAQIPLNDLRPVMESLQAQPGVLYVARYNAERQVMDLDVAFTQPRKDFEVLRLTLNPVKALRPTVQPRVAYLDKDGRPHPGNPNFERVASQGKYTYADLLAVAQNFGRKVERPATPAAPGAQTPRPGGQTPAATPPATPQTPAAQPANPPITNPATPPANQTPPAPAQTPPAGQATTPPAPTGQTPPPAQPQEQSQNPQGQTPPPQNAQQPGQTSQGQNQTQQPSSTQPGTQPQNQQTPPGQQPQGQQAQPGQAQPAPSGQNQQPGQAQPPQPGQAQLAQPGQAQPAQPGQTQPAPQQVPAAQPTPKTGLPGDFNEDSVVDQKDLELVRSSYRWANVGTPAPANNQNRPNQPAQTPPAQPNPPGQNNPNPGGGNGAPGEGGQPNPPPPPNEETPPTGG